jgi:hypothetical protein
MLLAMQAFVAVHKHTSTTNNYHRKAAKTTREETMTTQIHHRNPTSPFRLSSSAETLKHHNTEELENPKPCNPS